MKFFGSMFGCFISYGYGLPFKTYSTLHARLCSQSHTNKSTSYDWACGSQTLQVKNSWTCLKQPACSECELAITSSAKLTAQIANRHIILTAHHSFCWTYQHDIQWLQVYNILFSTQAKGCPNCQSHPVIYAALLQTLLNKSSTLMDQVLISASPAACALQPA